MEVIPAIDVKDGKCVRLYQGDYGRETVYSDSPVDMAVHWVELGASRLHVVDLEAARSGEPVILGLVRQIADRVSVPVQLGGGIRSVETASKAIDAGADRVIIGTAAVEEPDILREACDELGPDRVVVGVDARDGYVATRGWTETSRLPVSDLVERVEATGVRRIVYTDIARDGTLTEPNFGAIERLAGATALRLIVTGGISSVEHLVALSRLGVEGAIGRDGSLHGCRRLSRGGASGERESPLQVFSVTGRG